MSGIVFPYLSHITGRRVTARVRRDNPEMEDGRPKNKYISAYGDARHLYFPPEAWGDLQAQSTPIVLVESEKATLALTALGPSYPDTTSGRGNGRVLGVVRPNW